VCDQQQFGKSRPQHAQHAHAASTRKDLHQVSTSRTRRHQTAALSQESLRFVAISVNKNDKETPKYRHW